MAKISLEIARRMLSGIIDCVEAGMTSPIDAVAELAEIKADCEEELVIDGVVVDYTSNDFQRMRDNFLAEYPDDWDYYGDLGIGGDEDDEDY